MLGYASGARVTKCSSNQPPYPKVVAKLSSVQIHVQTPLPCFPVSLVWFDTGSDIGGMGEGGGASSIFDPTRKTIWQTASTAHAPCENAGGREYNHSAPAEKRSAIGPKPFWEREGYRAYGAVLFGRFPLKTKTPKPPSAHAHTPHTLRPRNLRRTRTAPRCCKCRAPHRPVPRTGRLGRPRSSPSAGTRPVAPRPNPTTRTHIHAHHS